MTMMTVVSQQTLPQLFDYDVAVHASQPNLSQVTQDMVLLIM